ncbi:MAG: hypothetical protein LW650_06785 [Planctomycetaceae bacterium]|jgi:hypothetical protein|nr:hypothetical protein [Phycisphaerales bacterium]MCE2653205.1 hypothetical protein [Planctomycetaceae bacterium]
MIDHEKRAFRERLRTYLLGVGIGLTLTGMLLYARWQARQAPGGPAPTAAPTAPAASNAASPAAPGGVPTPAK